MAIYQVFDNYAIGLTTDLKQAEEFLDKIDGAQGIHLLKLNNETGQFEKESFSENGRSLRKITREEKATRLPDKLYILEYSSEFGIDVYLTEEYLLKNIPYYHESNGEIFQEFGNYSDNFAAYVLFDNVLEGLHHMTYDKAIKSLETDFYIGEVKVEKLTVIDMGSVGEKYLPRIDKKNLRKVYDLSQAYIKIMR